MWKIAKNHRKALADMVLLEVVLLVQEIPSQEVLNGYVDGTHRLIGKDFWEKNLKLNLGKLLLKICAQETLLKWLVILI